MCRNFDSQMLFCFASIKEEGHSSWDQTCILKLNRSSRRVGTVHWDWQCTTDNLLNCVLLGGKLPLLCQKPTNVHCRIQSSPLCCSNPTSAPRIFFLLPLSLHLLLSHISAAILLCTQSTGSQFSLYMPAHSSLGINLSYDASQLSFFPHPGGSFPIPKHYSIIILSTACKADLSFLLTCDVKHQVSTPL